MEINKTIQGLKHILDTKQLSSHETESIIDAVLVLEGILSQQNIKIAFERR